MPRAEHAKKRRTPAPIVKADLPVCPVCNNEIDPTDQRLRWRAETICLPCGMKLSVKDDEIRWRSSKTRGENAAQKCLREAGEFQADQTSWRERFARNW